MTSVLTMNDLSKAYGRKLAVNGLTLTVGEGQIFGLLGPNGSGKTTTLGILLGVIRADKGSFSWFGQGADGAERRKIGALLEQPSFYPWLSGRANLEVTCAAKKVSKAAIEPSLKTVGLWDAKEQLFQTYSLGMKQRLAIAAALVGKPKVLVLDEPTNGVDAQGIVDIRAIVKNFAHDGGTVILASHLLDEVEKVCSDVAILKDGAILKAGSTSAILATNGWIELGALDLNALAGHLHALAPTARIEQRESLLALYDSDLAPSDLNRSLIERGVVLSHLVKCQPSLESQYLHLVGKAPK